MTFRLTLIANRIGDTIVWVGGSGTAKVSMIGRIGIWWWWIHHKDIVLRR